MDRGSEARPIRAFARSAKLGAAGFTAGERTSRSDANKAFVAEGRSRERGDRIRERNGGRIEVGTFLSTILPHGRTKRPFARHVADTASATGSRLRTARRAAPTSSILGPGSAIPATVRANHHDGRNHSAGEQRTGCTETPLRIPCTPCILWSSSPVC